MELFDVGEIVREGLPIGVHEETNSVFLDIGRCPKDPETAVYLPYGTELSQKLLSEDNPLNVKQVKGVVLKKATIAREAGELCIVQHTQPDKTALVRAAIAYGEGGKIEYFFGEGVDVLAEGVIGIGEIRYPVFVLVMPEGSSFHVHRTGDICGAPATMSFTWDGMKIVQGFE